MILTRNVVVDGQTLFSGERIPAILTTSEAWQINANVQEPMNWLSEHQTNLRLEKELIQEHILSQQKSSPNTSGDIKP